MGKQLKFTKFEQSVITELIKNLGAILLEKMDKGVEAPTLSGTMHISDEGRVVEFEITAKKAS